MLSVCDGDTKVVWAVRTAVSLSLGSKIVSYLASSDSWHVLAVILENRALREGNNFITPPL